MCHELEFEQIKQKAHKEVTTKVGCRLQKTTKFTDGLQVCGVHFFITKVCTLYPPFQTTKICSVHFFRIQKFVVSPFTHSKFDFPLFETTKVYSPLF